jgi:hypothetical protein
MFDTVRLSTETTIHPDRLKSRGWSWFTSGHRDAEGMEVEQTCYSPPEIDHPHYIRYYPASGTLKIETSLPKVLHGENVTLLSADEVDKTLDELSNRVSDVTGADIPHVGDWTVRGRVDAVFAWDTRFGGKSHIGDYLHAFKSVELPRHYCQAVDREETLYWRNSSRVIRMYDKEKETGMKEASGLLRFEVQLNHAKKELTDLGASSIKARDVLHWHTARAVLNRYLDGLGADLVITDEEKLFQHLRENSGNTKAFRLIGCIRASQFYSRDELIGLGYSRKTLWRYSNEIYKAGASMGTSKCGLLPPLTLPGEDDYNGKAKRLQG